MPMPKYLTNLDGTAGKPLLSEGTMLSEGPVNDCNSTYIFQWLAIVVYTQDTVRNCIVTCPVNDYI